MVISSIPVWCLVLGLLDLKSVYGRQRFRNGQYDVLVVTRCEAKCWGAKTKNSCVKSCLLKGGEKPGICPKNNTLISPFAAACIEACHNDFQCPELTKCCKHHCGITCQYPQELSSSKGLPEIPKDINIKDGRKKRTIVLEWKPGETKDVDKGGGPTLYVIQERHHSGRHFSEDRLSQYTVCAKTGKTSHILRNFLKPGCWYRFRVAAINANGTRGYSEVSLPFSLAMNPKAPKAPRNVTVGPLWTTNNSLNAEISWSPPPSDLPIEKYKIFWSRRLHGASALDSVLVHQRFVPRHQTKFFLYNLIPKSLYFLQVQAIVQFGSERLKGEKSGLVLNTTNFFNATNNTTFIADRKGRIENLKLQKLFWSKGDLRARVHWKPRKGSFRYTVTWWVGPCHDNLNRRSYIKLAATTKDSQFDLYDLHFNCRYRVNIRDISSKGKKSVETTSLTFTTPSCEKFKFNYKKVQCMNLKD